MSEWKEFILGELVSKITKGTTPTKGKGFVEKEGVNYIKSDAINYDGKVDSSKFLKIDINTHEKLKRSQLEEDDILFSMAGNYLGKSGIVTKEMLPANTNQALAIIRMNKEMALPKFISYCFRQPNMIRYVNSMSAQSAQPNINFQEISSLQIILPSIQEQKEVINILDNLDQKITLLRQQNQTLEELAQTLFKRWFVDFEFPNENGDSYKSSGGEMISSELGEIPEGWRVGKLKEIAKLVAGGDKPKNVSSFPTKELNVPIYSNGIKEDGLYGYTDISKIDEESITVSARGTIGFVCLRDQPYLPIVRLISVIPNQSMMTAKYLYLWFKNQSIAGSGTTQQQLTVPVFGDFEIIIPDLYILKNFSKSIDSFYNKISMNNNEIRSLTQIRDTLLPKLMSGELKLN